VINLLRAEWKKTVWNYKLAGFLVWGYPVGAAGFYAVMLISGLIQRDWLEGMLVSSNPLWTENALSGWGILLAFPFTIFLRLMPLAFMASVFAGEYQAGMWKNLIPRNRRSFLILSKTAVVVGLLTAALAATSVILVAGTGAGRAWLGWEYGPALSGGVLGDFLVRYLQTALLGALSLTILAAMAALSAILTRSVLGSLLLAFLFSTVDSLSMFILMLLARIFSAPGLVLLYRYTPQGNINNAQSWFQTGGPMPLPFENFSSGPDLGFSLAVLAAWAAGLIAVALIVFERQDITS
jgi:ABC-type transport system involved in multi-copper enzyme maturation permease subunit